MTQSIQDILAGDDSAYTRVISARIPRAPADLWDEHERLDALLPTLTSDTIDAHPEREATAQRIAEIEAEFEESVIEVKFRGIGHRAWADLLRKHPPTTEQLKQNRMLDHNPDKFPEEAIAASAIDPVMTVDQVVALASKPWFNEKCWSELWAACLRVNVAEAAPNSLAARLILRQSEGSARRHTTTESLEASFSDA